MNYSPRAVNSLEWENILRGLVGGLLGEVPSNWSNILALLISMKCKLQGYENEATTTV